MANSIERPKSHACVTVIPFKVNEERDIKQRERTGEIMCWFEFYKSDPRT